MKKVSFGMCWELYGRQTIDLPDSVNANDPDEVIAYIKSVWENIPLPNGDYVSESDKLDEDSDIEVRESFE